MTIYHVFKDTHDPNYRGVWEVFSKKRGFVYSINRLAEIRQSGKTRLHRGFLENELSPMYPVCNWMEQYPDRYKIYWFEEKLK